MKSKSKASLLNLISGFLFQGVAAFGGFVIPGILLSRYGAALHGYISTVNNFMVYVSLATMGLSPAAIQAYYKPLAKKNNKEISCVYNTVAKLYNKAAVFYLGGLVIVMLILLISLKGQIDNIYIISILFAIGLNGVLECLLYSRCRVFLQADQSLYIVNFIDCIMYAIRIVVQIILVKNNASIVWIVVVPTIITPFKAIILKKIIAKKYIINKRICANVNLLGKRYSAFVHQISSMIVLNTDVVLLTLFGNLVLTSIYSVYNLVFSSIYGILTNIFKNGLVASFGNLIFEKKSQDRLKQVYDQYEFVYFIIVTIIYSCCGSLILPFVRLYTQGQAIAYENTLIAMLFLFIGLANNIRVPADTIITAAGHFKETQWRAVAEASINLTLSLILIHPLKIVGILLGTMVSFLYRSTDIIIYTYKYILNKKLFMCIKRIVRMILTIALCIFINAFILKRFHIYSWNDWMLVGIMIFFENTVLSLFVNYIFESEMIKNFLKTR